MKRSVSFILLSVLVLGVLSGCTGGPAAGGGSEDAAYLKEYDSTFSTAISSMNPYTTEATSDYVFISNIIDGLVETDRYGRPSPCLAESWEHNEDFSVWTFRLRPDVFWVDSEGEKTEHKVTADDFVAGMRYVADPLNSASNFSTVRNVISGLYDYYYRLVAIDEGEISDVTREDAVASFGDTVGVRALDELTVEYSLDGPCPYFLAYAQLDLLLPAEQAFLDEIGEDYGTARDKLLYCGGYYVSRWDLDKQVVLTRNEHYWDAASLTLDSLSWEYVSDGISSLEMFERGNISATSLSSEEVASVRGTEWEQYVYLSEKTATTFWYSFNFATGNPEAAAAVKNDNFRKAVFTAIDSVTLSAIWEPVQPEFFCRYTLLPENCMFDENGKDYTDYPGLAEYKKGDAFDSEEARAYMEAAVSELCEADGITLKGVTPGKVDMLPVAEFDADGKLPIDFVYSSGSSENEMKKAAIVKQMLETYLGSEYINVILAYSTNSFSSDIYDLNNWDLVDDSYGFRYADPSANLNRCTTDYDITYSSYDIPEFDALVEEADGIYGISERYAKYAQAELYLLDNALIKPYMSGGGSYNMTRIVPYTVPGGYFGLGRYKMKGAVIRQTPVTAAEYEALTQQYEAERAALSD